MARFRDIHLYPYSGHRRRPWGLPHTPSLDVDAAARTSRRVTEAVSRELAELGLLARVGEYRIFADEGANRDVVFIPPRTSADQFGGRVEIPGGFRFLDPETRADLIAQVVEAALLVIAAWSEWDPSVVSEAMRRVRVAGLQCDWIGPWNATPDRRSRVRLEGHIADDGYARWHLVVASTDSDDSVLVGEDVVGWTWLSNLDHAAQSLHFATPTTVEVMGGSGFNPEPVKINILTGRVHRTKRVLVPTQYLGDPAHVVQIPSIAVADPPDETISVNLNVVWQTSPKDMPTWRRAVGTYALHIWDHDEWRAWWARTGHRTLDIEMEIASDPENGPVKARVRVGKSRCYAWFTRINECRMSEADQIRAAARDVEIILGMIVERWKLPDHPPLPTAADIAVALKVDADQDRDLVRFIETLRGRLTKREVSQLLRDVYAGNTGDATGWLEGVLIEGRFQLTEDEQQAWSSINPRTR